GDEVGALDALLAVWRETRASDVAELIDAVSARLAPHVFQPAGKLEAFQAGWLAMVERGRPADLPRLLQTLLHETQRSGIAIVEAFAQRVRAIARWPADPRTGKWIAMHLRSSSFGAMSKSNQGAWKQIFQLVLDHDDPRSIALFEKVDFKQMFAG